VGNPPRPRLMRRPTGRHRTLVLGARPAGPGRSDFAEGAVDSGDQRLVVEGLPEVLDGAGPTRAIPRRGVIVRSDEHDRDPPAGGDEAPLPLQPPGPP